MCKKADSKNVPYKDSKDLNSQNPESKKAKDFLSTNPKLQTKRLILRKFQKSDLDALYKIYSDTETNTYLPWFVCKDTKEAKEIFTQKYQQNYAKQCGYHYAICLKEDNIPIGYVHIQGVVPYDLGYGLREEFWHKGYAREAAAAVVEQAKKEGLPYITATHDIENARSGAVMRALRMRFCYAYKERWQPKDKDVIFHLYQYNARDNIPMYQGYATKYELITTLHIDSHNAESLTDSQDFQGRNIVESKNTEYSNKKSKSNDQTCTQEFSKNSKGGI